ncbi:hypothetical protein [Thiohalocapsa halophila]|uniref:hypothetical protein n=1 Tax=Thiohalocapsa halophila TaxID=69359 RepID=UPI001904F77A|nr:hypothetical protein [Thiohalocapsa halophila]
MSEQPPNQADNRRPKAEAKAAARSGSPDTPESGRRRSLLKAAASAAPVIATLPSGEALANASALQCVINEQNQAGPPVTVDIPVPDDDTYVRVSGEVREYFTEASNAGPGERRTVYFFEGDVPQANILVNPDGSWFDDTGWQQDNSQTREAAFLVQYNATTTDPTTAEVNTECELEVGTDSWTGIVTGPRAPQHCFYPMAVKAPQGNAGNVPLTTSCLASFNGL